MNFVHDLATLDTSPPIHQEHTLIGSFLFYFSVINNIVYYIGGSLYAGLRLRLNFQDGDQIINFQMIIINNTVPKLLVREEAYHTTDGGLMKVAIIPEPSQLYYYMN